MKNKFYISRLLIVALLSVVVFSSCKKNKDKGELTLNESEFSVSSLKSEATFVVQTGGDWNAVSDSEWCSVNPASGNGETRVIISVEANPTNKIRVAKIKVTGSGKVAEATVTQAPFANLVVDPSVVSIAKEAGSAATVRVVSTGPWSVASEIPSWLKLSATSGDESAETQLVLTCEANTDEFPRYANIDVQINDSKKDLVTIRVTQLGIRGTYRQSDSLALHAIYSCFDLSGIPAADAKKVWDPNKPISQWMGVTLERSKDGEMRVTKLSLFTAMSVTVHRAWRLGTPMPEDLGYLDQLTSFSCYTSHIPGPIPQSIGKLVNLTELNMADNLFSGPLPASMANLKKLKNVDFNCNNYLEGDMPTFIGEWLELEKLDLSFCSLSGIPDVFGKLENLTTLSLNNMMKVKDDAGDGPIAPGAETEDMGPGHWEITSTVHHPIIYDPITGENIGGGEWAWIPDAAGVAGRKLDAWGRNNPLRAPGNGDGPDITGGSGNGVEIYPEGRTFPVSLTRLKKLRELRLNNSNFGGRLPDNMGDMSALEMFYGYSNKFEGNIPVSMSTLPNLVLINLAMNKMSGEISPELGKTTNLRVLNISENGFTGGLPGELGKCTYLQTVDVSFNKLSGTITDDLLRGSGLMSLILSNNAFIGTIPDNIGNHIAMETFEADNNQFTGLSNKIGGAGSLARLGMAGNKLTSIPEGVKYLSKCTYLNFADNNITGPIPTYVAGMYSLSALVLHGNLMSGAMPEFTGAYTKPSNCQINWSLVCPQREDNKFTNCPSSDPKPINRVTSAKAGRSVWR